MRMTISSVVTAISAYAICTTSPFAQPPPVVTWESLDRNTREPLSIVRRPGPIEEEMAANEKPFVMPSSIAATAGRNQGRRNSGTSPANLTIIHGKAGGTVIGGMVIAPGAIVRGPINVTTNISRSTITTISGGH